jgi:hypothetical protein
MTTKAEAEKAIIDCLKRIGQEYKINFEEFSTETFSGGGYKAGKWTYKINNQWVAVNYWFSSFSNRKEEVKTSYIADDDRQKLEADLRECVGNLRQFVKRKTSTF